LDENVRPRLNPEDRRADELRAWRGFGVGLGILFCLFAWRAWRKGGHETALAAAAVACLTAAFVRPEIFRPLYKTWMPVARFLARINTWVVCAILYYLVLTPYAVFARMLGARFLRTPPKDQDSFWIVKPPRDPAVTARESF
jgi:hypothetical protein